jgi:GDP-D-mannose dehydratase
MGKCALITGITGQAGSYPPDLLLAKGYDVPGLKCQSFSLRTDRLIISTSILTQGDPPLLLSTVKSSLRTSTIWLLRADAVVINTKRNVFRALELARVQD